MKIPTKYCVTCGTELNSKKVFYQYDQDTGKKLYDIEYRCPKRRTPFKAFHYDYNPGIEYLPG